MAKATMVAATWFQNDARENSSAAKAKVRQGEVMATSPA
jgi:hypothetical protein